MALSSNTLSPTDLRTLQLVELELLKEVDRICRKNDIRYSLYAGTMLGAVRHQGFIPWDDDADIFFLPEEYEKFFEACRTDLNTEKFFLQDYRTDPHYRWGYAKLRRNDSAFVRTGQEHISCHTGICIDLFVMYNVPDNTFLRKWHYGAFTAIRKILYSAVGKKTASNPLLRGWYTLLSKIPRDTVLGLAQKLTYKKPSELRDIMYFPHSKRYIGIPSTYFDADTELTFEGHSFFVVKEYDSCLRLPYGDYMQFPPESDRESHNPASKIVFPKEYRHKRLLLLGGSAFQIPVIEKAKELGLYVGVVDIDEKAPGHSCADECFVCSIKDKEAVLKIARAFKADGILCGACDTGVVTAAYVCEKLGLPGIGSESALKATDKYHMICAFREHGVAHPEFQQIKAGENILLSDRLSYPLIVKPVDSAGSRGLNLITNENELVEKVTCCTHHSPSGEVILEEFMDGPEVSVEVVVVNGTPHILQITDKTTSGPPLFIEVSQSQPSALPTSSKQGIAELAAKAVLAVGLKNSTAHVEIKLTKAGPKMVELGARLGGDFITSYLIDTSVCGVNMMECAIQLALGETPDVSHYENSGTCVCVENVLSQGGVLTQIKGIQKLRRLKGVQQMISIAEVGKRYEAATSNADRIVYLITTGNTPEQARKVAQKAMNTLELVYQ